MKKTLLSLLLVALIVLPAHFAYTGLTDGLVLYLPFDEGNGDKAKDLSGNGNNAVVSAAEWVEGKYGEAIATAAGGTNCVIVPHSESLLIEGEITIMAWLKTTEYNVDLKANWLNKGAETDQEGLMYSVYLNKGFVGTGFGSAEGRHLQTPNLIGHVKLNEWTHVAVTLDANAWTVYINGKKGESRKVDFKFMGTNTVDLDIGCAEKAQYSYTGAIDEVYIYSRALSEAEVNQVMTGGLSVEAQDKLSTTWAGIKVQ